MPTSTLTVLIPYYNEAGFIADTLRSLLAQTRLPDEILLVDNASTDGSEAVCRAVIEAAGYPHARYLREARPGKTHALESGCALVTSDLLAICDADTFYPPHYLALAERLFDQSEPDTVAVMAQCVEGMPSHGCEVSARLRETVRLSRRFSTKCFAGGAGQVYRTRALQDAGGFSEDRWPFVLEDHEIMHRLHKLGRSVYHENLWCLPSDRRSNRCGVSWNLLERMVYRYTPHAWGDWYFYGFLGPRFRKRGMAALKLRDQPWLQPRG